MGYWRNISPRGALADLWHQWREPNPYRWHILAVSVALTFTMLVLLIPETQRVEPRRPEVTFITTFEPGRTDAQIAESNRANQSKQDKLRAEQAAREEKAKDAYRALGRATGLDVDAMEREIARQDAQKEARIEQPDQQTDSGLGARRD